MLLTKADSLFTKHSLSTGCANGEKLFLARKKTLLSPSGNQDATRRDQYGNIYRFLCFMCADASVLTSKDARDSQNVQPVLSSSSCLRIQQLHQCVSLCSDEANVAITM